MKSFGGLMESICSTGNLAMAMAQAMHGKAKSPETLRFVMNADTELAILAKELRLGTYQLGTYRQFRIMDPKPRLISCAPFRDRVAQHAICNLIGPVMDQRFINGTYACRKKKGTHKAVLKAQSLSRQNRYFCKIDVSKFFDSIDHDVLISVMKRLFREHMLLDTLERIVRHPFPMQKRGKGLPIGNLTSQWFANLYLDGADHLMTDHCGIPGYIRYMDDMLLFADTKEMLWQHVNELVAWLEKERRLGIKAKAFILAPTSEGIPYLGFRIFPSIIRLQHRRYHRMRRLIRKKEKEYRLGNIDEKEMIDSIRPALSDAIYYGIRPGIN